MKHFILEKKTLCHIMFLSATIHIFVKKIINKMKLLKEKNSLCCSVICLIGITLMFKQESVREDFLKDDCLVKIILIRSKSFPVVEAKLMVYRRYSQEINDKNIYLQHELEEIDEVAKICAYKKLSEIRIFVESVIETFETYLYEPYEKPLTPDRIIQIFTQTKDITVENGRYQC